MNNEPGWYPQSDGQQKYWDGQNWTEQLAPVAVVEPVPFDGPAIGGPDALEELEEAKSAAKRMVWIGLAVLVVGIVITVVTYSAAAPGGRFIAAWGAILFGGIRMCQGLFYLANPTRLLKKADA